MERNLQNLGSINSSERRNSLRYPILKQLAGNKILEELNNTPRKNSIHSSLENPTGVRDSATDADTYIGGLSNVSANIAMSRYYSPDKNVRKTSNSPVNFSAKISGIKKR